MKRTKKRKNYGLLSLVAILVIPLLILIQCTNTDAAETEKKQEQHTQDASSDNKEAGAEALPEIEMVFVKGGCFQMGDTFRDGGEDERPVHEICVEDFYIGKYEVTQAQWKAVMGDNPSGFKDCGDDCPIENVSWDDVKGFIEKLRDKTGKRYRLPTEAEWEYAARSGGMGAKWSGTNDVNKLTEYAWYADNAATKTHPVGQKKPNSLGIYDMSGNVSEWVMDRYDEKYYKQSPKENPRGPASGGYRVLRGGIFYDIARHTRTTSRDEYPQTYRISCVGFRLLMVP